LADLFSWWKQDLTILPDGDLLSIGGTVEGEQRVVRRLLTNGGDYIWNPEYGGGLPKFVGSVASTDTVQAVIASQIFLEDAVSQVPLPVITVTETSGGYMTANVQYVDSTVDKLVTVGFDINA
jgi:hypothetical protein